MIRAGEARKRSTEHLEKLLSTEFAEIERKVMTAIQEGKYSISHSGHLSKEAENALVNLGYRVTTGSQYNEPYYTIEWQ